jgi:hypothetical protein
MTHDAVQRSDLDLFIRADLVLYLWFEPEELLSHSIDQSKSFVAV